MKCHSVPKDGIGECYHHRHWLRNLDRLRSSLVKRESISTLQKQWFS